MTVAQNRPFSAIGLLRNSLTRTCSLVLQANSTLSETSAFRIFVLMLSCIDVKTFQKKNKKRFKKRKKRDKN